MTQADSQGEEAAEAEENSMTNGAFVIEPSGTSVNSSEDPTGMPSVDERNDILDSVNGAPPFSRDGQAPVAGPNPGSESHLDGE